MTLVTGVLCPGGTGGASVSVNFDLRGKRQVCQGIEIAQSEYCFILSYRVATNISHKY